MAPGGGGVGLRVEAVELDDQATLATGVDRAVEHPTVPGQAVMDLAEQWLALVHALERHLDDDGIHRRHRRRCAGDDLHLEALHIELQQRRSLHHPPCQHRIERT